MHSVARITICLFAVALLFPACCLGAPAKHRTIKRVPHPGTRIHVKVLRIRPLYRYPRPRPAVRRPRYPARARKPKAKTAKASKSAAKKQTPSASPAKAAETAPATSAGKAQPDQPSPAIIVTAQPDSDDTGPDSSSQPSQTATSGSNDTAAQPDPAQDAAASAAYVAGETAAIKGDTVGAILQWRAALKLKPNSSFTRQALERAVTSQLSKHPTWKLTGSPCGGTVQDISGSSAEKEFMRITGHANGWASHTVAYIIPLSHGGCDDLANLMWKTSPAGY